MELVIIISTITSFFSHLLIERVVVANLISVFFATLITWLLIATQIESAAGVALQQLMIIVLVALAISIVVGMVFTYHKKCSKQ